MENKKGQAGISGRMVIPINAETACNGLPLVAPNRRFCIENQAIQNGAIRIERLRGRFKYS